MMQNMEWVASLQHWKIVTVMGYYYLRFSQEKDQQMKHLKVATEFTNCTEFRIEKISTITSGQITVIS